jgi:proline iminopeptidase
MRRSTMRHHLETLFVSMSIVAVIFGCGMNDEPPPPSSAGASADGLEPLNVEGALLSYSAEGHGIPCVVFTGGENIGLKIYSSELKQHLRLIHADPSKVSKEELADMTLNDILDDIEKVRIALGIERIAVMGHSMFSVLPPEYALRYPEHASHIISTGGVPSFSDESTQASNEYWETAASAESKAILEHNREQLTEEVPRSLSPSDVFIRQYVADTPLRFRDPKFDMTDLWDGVEINMDFVNRYWGLIYGYDNTRSFHLITAPYLVVAGRYDYGCPYSLYDRLNGVIPNYTFLLFENAGHNPMFEVPEEFDEKLIEWITSH